MTKFDYDLNIFKREQEVSTGVYDHVGPWYMHLYQVDARGHQELGQAFELTESEANNLINNDPYFDEPDVWYGLEGFLVEKGRLLSERLTRMFNSLPVYREEVLF